MALLRRRTKTVDAQNVAIFWCFNQHKTLQWRRLDWRWQWCDVLLVAVAALILEAPIIIKDLFDEIGLSNKLKPFSQVLSFYEIVCPGCSYLRLIPAQAAQLRFVLLLCEWAGWHWTSLGQQVRSFFLPPYREKKTIRKTYGTWVLLQVTTQTTRLLLLSRHLLRSILG